MVVPNDVSPLTLAADIRCGLPNPIPPPPARIPSPAGPAAMGDRRHRTARLPAQRSNGYAFPPIGKSFDAGWQANGLLTFRRLLNVPDISGLRLPGSTGGNGLVHQNDTQGGSPNNEWRPEDHRRRFKKPEAVKLDDQFPHANRRSLVTSRSSRATGCRWQVASHQ